MDRKLKHWEARIISKGLFRGTNYLVRLKERMQRAGFSRDDEIYVAVEKAYEASRHLSVLMHHRSCRSGVCRPYDPDLEGEPPRCLLLLVLNARGERTSGDGDVG